LDVEVCHLVTDSSEPQKPLGVHQMFLLLSMEFGFSTSYNFLSRLQMSVNSSAPRLQQMELQGLVELAPGPRRKAQYSLTDAGRRALRESLEHYRDRGWSFDRTLTFENLPQAILVAWFHSGTGGALQCLDEAEGQIREKAKAKKAEAENLREAMTRLQSEVGKYALPIDGVTFLSTTFTLMRAELIAGELEYQADSLPAIRQIIRKMPPPSAVAGSNFDYFAGDLKPVTVHGGE
jgi:DNA-binding PadR family transcriptional regulator